MVKHKIAAAGLPADLLQRERLFLLLDDCCQKQVCWISGPGGSGKTTLVSSYLASRNLPAIWYQVDQGDADAATFFYYMGLACQEVVGPGQHPLPLLTPEYLGGIKTFARRYFEELFIRLPAPFAIILDNYQDISLSSHLHELILEGLTVIPDGITLIAVSRNEPPPVYTAHHAAEHFAFLGWNDLRLTFNEARQVAGVEAQSILEGESFTRLYAKTDGWIAGLLLILESLKGSAHDDQLLERLPLDKVFDYFSDKIFQGSDDELQCFLLKTALAPGITVQMAEQLTGIGSSEHILAKLCRNRFFTGKTSPIDSIYQYHPLFRKFLLDRAEQTFTAPELREIRRRAAALLNAAGRTEDAAGLLMEAADWDNLTELVLAAAPLFASEGRSETVLAWLESMPGEMLETVPGLLYWKGVCLLLHSPPESRSCFRKAFELYCRVNDRVGMCLSWSGGAEVSLYDGEFTPLDQWLSLLKDMRLDDLAFPSQQLEDRISMSVFNAMAFRQPHHCDLSKWRERAFPLVRGSADINFRLQSAVHLVVHDLWDGNFPRASFLLQQTQGMARSRSVTPMTEITILNAQVLHCFFTGAWELGVTLAHDARRLSDETGVHVWDSQLLGMGATCALCLGDSTTADELLGGMESRLEWSGKRIDVGQYHGLRGYQESLRNDFPAAAPHLQLAQETFNGIGFLATEAVVLNAQVENLRLLGAAEEAGATLRRAYHISNGMGSRFLEFHCLVNSVQLALDACDELQADLLLRKAMALGSAGGYVTGWLWRPASLVRLCTRALAIGIEVEYVSGLIRRWSLVPETPPLHIDAWPWPLKIITLGSFQLIRDNEPVVLTGRAKKPLELLKALIAFGGKNVAQERLTDALWPDVDGDLAQSSFDTTLHRLRKLLGNDKVLQLQAGRLSINARCCWVDTWAFERICGEIDIALSTEGRQDKARLVPCFEKGASLYKGSFLPQDGDQAWAMPLREQMRSRFVRLFRAADASS